jgi:hypothetical protein
MSQVSGLRSKNKPSTCRPETCDLKPQVQLAEILPFGLAAKDKIIQQGIEPKKLGAETLV